MVSDKIEDQVVTLVALGEIFLGVIDHVVRADGSDKIDIPRAADAGDFGAE